MKVLDSVFLYTDVLFFWGCAGRFFLVAYITKQARAGDVLRRGLVFCFV